MSTQRYDRLWAAINRGLEENRNTINLREAITVAYGKDIHIFTGADGETSSHSGVNKDAAVDMLASLLEGVLERADESIRSEIKKILQTEKVQEQLDRLDMILHEFNMEMQAAKDAEIRDKVTAQDEAKRAKLPEGVSVSDLLTLQVYKSRSRHHQDLIDELRRIEEENSGLEKQIQLKRDEIRLQLDKIEEHGKILESAADEFSLHGAL
jgi:hypothetical protein